MLHTLTLFIGLFTVAVSSQVLWFYSAKHDLNLWPTLGERYWYNLQKKIVCMENPWVSHGWWPPDPVLCFVLLQTAPILALESFRLSERRKVMSKAVRQESNAVDGRDLVCGWGRAHGHPPYWAAFSKASAWPLDGGQTQSTWWAYTATLHHPWPAGCLVPTYFCTLRALVGRLIASMHRDKEALTLACRCQAQRRLGK